MAKLGENVEVSVKAGKIIIEIDPSVDLGPSKSGKTNLVATTHGWTTFATDKHMVGISLNVNRT